MTSAGGGDSIIWVHLRGGGGWSVCACAPSSNKVIIKTFLVQFQTILFYVQKRLYIFIHGNIITNIRWYFLDSNNCTLRWRKKVCLYSKYSHKPCEEKDTHTINMIAIWLNTVCMYIMIQTSDVWAKLHIFNQAEKKYI